MLNMNRTSGYRTSGVETGSKPVSAQKRVPKLVPNRFGTGLGTNLSENRTLYPVFRRLRYSKRPITGRLCPVIGRLRYSKRPITGRLCPVFGRLLYYTTSDNRT